MKDNYRIAIKLSIIQSINQSIAVYCVIHLAICKLNVHQMKDKMTQNYRQYKLQKTGSYSFT